MTVQVRVGPFERHRVSAPDNAAARSLLGLPDAPTIVAVGPFDDPEHTGQLAGALAALRRRCEARLVFPGVDVVRKHRWSDLIAAADVVVPSTTTGSRALLDVMALGRAMVAPANPATVRLVVPASAGLVYRPGDTTGMAAALLRLLTTPSLCHGMACRAREVARRHHLEHVRKNRDEGSEYD
jgi:glycosyltransferase involved in cell wall biosynthesis